MLQVRGSHRGHRDRSSEGAKLKCDVIVPQLFRRLSFLNPLKYLFYWQ